MGRHVNYLSWSKNNKNLTWKKLGPKKINGYIHNVNELTIEKAQRNDGGVYTCTRYVKPCRNDTSRKASVQLIFQG